MAVPDNLEIPENPTQRFVEIYSELNQRRRWHQGASALRFAALSAIVVPESPKAVADKLLQQAEALAKESGWFGELNSELRFIVGAILIAHNDSAEAFLVEAKRVHSLFRAESLRNGGIYETMAILLLRVQVELQPIKIESIQRFKELYNEMKRHHWWLTGPEDFPACAILTHQELSAAEIGIKIEEIFQALRIVGFSSGDPLQTAANMLYLAKRPAQQLAAQFRDLAGAFKSRGVSLYQSDYDELAILCLLEHDTDEIVQCTLRHRITMASLRPKPDRSMTFSLAASVTFLEMLRADIDAGTISNAKALMDMQNVIQAQQAAAATVVAVTASS